MWEEIVQYLLCYESSEWLLVECIRYTSNELNSLTKQPSPLAKKKPFPGKQKGRVENRKVREYLMWSNFNWCPHSQCKLISLSDQISLMLKGAADIQA